MIDLIRYSLQTGLGEARYVIGAALALGWGSGCGFGGAPIEDLGNTGRGLGLRAPEAIPEKEFLEQIDPGFGGHWVGYVEDPFQRDELGQPVPAVFPSGSTEVTLDYRFDGERFTPSATLVFGAGPAPVPERGVAYPPGINHYYTGLRTARGYSFRAPVVEGFEYELTEQDPSLEGHDPGSASLLTFVELAAFQQWCGLQVPQPISADRFGCLGASGFGGGDPLGGVPCTAFSADGTEQPVDCNFAVMCIASDLCRCTAENCYFDQFLKLSDVFLERQGDQIVGTVSGATLDSGRPGWYTPMGTLRLSRIDE
jgi:hypothetical protein